MQGTTATPAGRFHFALVSHLSFCLFLVSCFLTTPTHILVRIFFSDTILYERFPAHGPYLATPIVCYVSSLVG
ncbi:hypothetical protein B0H10DRAFT_2017573 [Mycena sp. CBHHK59/15]|nr:hypothetical protein B0H10DRAFT_2017573 [Mycena sp. CBHHK59/15]